MTYVGEDNPYLKLLKPFILHKKVKLGCGKLGMHTDHGVQQVAPDAWGVDDTPVRALFEPMEKWLAAQAPSIQHRYDPSSNVQTWLGKVVREMLLSVSLYFLDHLC